MKPYINTKERYAIVDSRGNVLAKFKLRLTAIQSISNYKLGKHEKLKIIVLDDDGGER